MKVCPYMVKWGEQGEIASHFYRESSLQNDLIYCHHCDQYLCKRCLKWRAPIVRNYANLAKINFSFSQNKTRDLKEMLVGEDNHVCSNKNQFFRLYRKRANPSQENPNQQQSIEIKENQPIERIYLKGRDVMRVQRNNNDFIECPNCQASYIRLDYVILPLTEDKRRVVKAGKVGQCGVTSCSYVFCTLCQKKGTCCSHFLEYKYHYQSMCERALKEDYNDATMVQQVSQKFDLLKNNKRFFEKNFDGIKEILGKGFASKSAMTAEFKLD